METEMPLLSESLALTEKKVDMALDDLIKLSKRKTNVNKGKRPRREKRKTQNFNGTSRNNTSKVRHHMNSLSGVRQGAVAKRRSYFQGNQFPVTTNDVRQVATAPPLSVRGRGFNGANQLRRIAPPVQNRSGNARHAKHMHELDQKVEHRGWKKKTLDSRFASMKEQRMNNHGVTVQVSRLPPWARARLFPH